MSAEECKHSWGPSECDDCFVCQKCLLALDDDYANKLEKQNAELKEAIKKHQRNCAGKCLSDSYRADAELWNLLEATEPKAEEAQK